MPLYKCDRRMLISRSKIHQGYMIVFESLQEVKHFAIFRCYMTLLRDILDITTKMSEFLSCRVISKPCSVYLILDVLFIKF